MRVKVKSIIVATITLIFLTALPLASLKLIPSELFLAASTTGGIDLVSLLSGVSVVGLVTAVLIISSSMIEKHSKAGLALSISSKLFWFVVILFILGLGKIENFGLGVLSSESNGVSNIVTLDLRLIAFLTAIIVSLKVVNSILEFKEQTPTPTQTL